MLHAGYVGFFLLFFLSCLFSQSECRRSSVLDCRGGYGAVVLSAAWRNIGSCGNGNVFILLNHLGLNLIVTLIFELHLLGPHPSFLQCAEVSTPGTFSVTTRIKDLLKSVRFFFFNFNESRIRLASSGKTLLRVLATM